MALPIVRLFLLGGTITMENATHHGARPSLDATALCAAVPGLDQVAKVEARTDHMIASGNLTFDHAFDLIDEIEKAVQSGDADGFVIVQGTDTLEEMAFLLDCLLDVDCPVVVTGAMRSASQLSADGPANILAAVACAATSSMASVGVIVVMNDDIHSARFVRKSHTGNVAAFRSPDTGPLGRMVEGRVRLLCRPVPALTLPVPINRKFPDVALVTATLGDQGHLLALLEKSPCQGVVIEGFGAGHLPEKYLSHLDKLTKKIPVILCSRTSGGHVFRETYGYSGAEIDLINRGLISSGILDGLKAKILLTLLIMSGAGRDQIHQSFEHWN